MDKTIHLSITNKDVPVHIDVVQYFTKPNIVFILDDYVPTVGAAAALYIDKPSGTKIYNSCTISGNQLIYKPTTQSFAEVGINPGQLQIIEQGGTAFSFLIFFDVSKNIIDDSAVESQDEFTILEQALQNVSQYDDEIEELQLGVAALDTRITENASDISNLGTRADTIEDGITALDDRVVLQEKAPYQYEPDRDEKYRERVRSTIASWLEADYLSTSFVGNRKGKEVAPGVYGGYRYSYDTYNKAPIGEYVYGDSRTVEEKYSSDTYTVQVMDLTCCSFTSLITKGYHFDDSIYKDSCLGLPYDRAKAIEQATFIYNEDRNDYIGYDINNNTTTHEAAEALYYSGAEVLRISRIEYGQSPEINIDAINKLETGDQIYMGLGNQSREHQFWGIHHVAVYVRSLEEIDRYLTDGRQLRISDVRGTRYTSHPEWGYIVHVLNGGNPKTGINVLRVDTLEWAINHISQYSGDELNYWATVYGFKTQPNTLNSAGGFEASTSIRNAWGKFRITDWEDKKSVFSIRTSNGGVETRSLGSSGLALTYKDEPYIDFNTILENGDYSFRSNNANSGYLRNNPNRPCTMFGVLHVRNNPIPDFFPDEDLTYPKLSMTTQTYEAYSGTTNHYYKLQRHIGIGNANNYYWSQWYIVFTTDPRGTDKTQYDEGTFPDCEPDIKPMVKKYF